jgi:hypothetical protein
MDPPVPFVSSWDFIRGFFAPFSDGQRFNTSYAINDQCFMPNVYVHFKSNQTKQDYYSGTNYNKFGKVVKRETDSKSAPTEHL